MTVYSSCTRSIVTLVAFLPLILAVDGTSDYIDPIIQTSESPMAWNVKEVGEWLQSIGLEEYVSAFEHHEIDGEALVSLSMDELSDTLNVHKLGHKKKIQNTIQKLNEQHPYDDGSRTFSMEQNTEGYHQYTPGEQGARGFNDHINWVNDLSLGLKISQDSGKPMLLLIHNTACHQCSKLKTAFSSSEFASKIETLSDSFVMVNLQNEEEPKETKYQPDGEYIPRMMFLSPEGEIDRELTNTKGTKGYDFFYYRGFDVVREMETARKKYHAAKPPAASSSSRTNNGSDDEANQMSKPAESATVAATMPVYTEQAALKEEL